METTIQNKKRKKMRLDVAIKAAGQRQKGIIQKQAAKISIGKTQEQIRIEAVQQLREMGIFI